MKESLIDAYDRNLAIIRMKRLINDGHAVIGNGPGKLRIPVLSGPTGIGNGQKGYLLWGSRGQSDFANFERRLIQVSGRKI